MFIQFDAIALLMAYLPTLEHYCTIFTAMITICSALANFLPHPQEEKANKILSALSKFINTVALNITKLKKEG